MLKRQLDFKNWQKDNMKCKEACFAAGTLVHTEQGLVPIEQLKVGDKVLSRNADGSGELVYKAVTKTMVTHNSPIFMMEFDVYVDPILDEADLNYRRRLRKRVSMPQHRFYSLPTIPCGQKTEVGSKPKTSPKQIF